MEKFNGHTIDDLVFNKSFRNWVLSHNSSESEFWCNWASDSHDRAELVNNAKAIIYALAINFNHLSEESIDEEIRKTLIKLAETPEHPDESVQENTTNRKGKARFYFIATAAAAAVIMAFIIPIYFRENNAATARTINQHSSFPAEMKNSSMETISTGSTTRNLVLPDGSKAILSPNTTLSYFKDLSGNKRQLFLSGEAIFDVVKNPSRPFLVYTNSLVTKVLGTVFRIKAYDSDKTNLITVTSGKVSVFNAAHFKDSLSVDKEPGGLILTPNQQVVCNKNNNQLKKTLTENPVLIMQPANKTFHFTATPVAGVFAVLVEAYGIPIVYDEDMIASCSLSANMGSENFYRKLEVICSAINATYEMIDGSIVITSAGCN